MKKGVKKGLSLIIVTMILISMLPVNIMAEDVNVVNEKAVNQESLDVNRDIALTTSTENEKLQESKTDQRDKLNINGMEEIPLLNDELNVENQIVVIYNESSRMNTQSLSLTTSEIEAGEHVSDRVDILELDTEANTEEIIRKIGENPSVMAVDKNEKIEISALPNDPEVMNGSAWQFENIGAEQTWDKVTNLDPVVVAVIDSGLNINHPDLTGRIVSGYDYVAKKTEVTDVFGHGTAVSGCIAAVTNNGIGIAGTAGLANVKIAPFRVGGTSSSDNFLDSGYICAALINIGDRPDIDVVNMSFGSYQDNASEAAAINYAADKGKILVSAAGNQGDSDYDGGERSYPASYDNVVSVAATDSDDTCPSWSQYNDRVDLSAPGDLIYTTLNTGDYGYMSGTSFSSPIVAGACAVLLAADSGLSSASVESILEDTALDIGDPGKDVYCGNGLIQIDKALDSVFSPNKLLKVDTFTSDKTSGQLTNTSVQLAASATGGNPPYQYKFYYQLGTTTTTLQDFSVTAMAIFKPITVGSYALYVDVKDASGTISSKSIVDYQVMETENEFEYTSYDEGVCITKYTGYDGNVDIPSTLGGEKVLAIGDNAFAECSWLTSITIPEDVLTIGKSAFSSCYNLKDVTMGKKITTIRKSAFSNCTSLTSINIPESVATIGTYAFSNCYSATSIILPENMSIIPAYTFQNCTALTNITIPDSIVTIDSYAFAFCTSLQTITIPNNMTTISQGTFWQCSNLKSVTMPDTLTTIDSFAFSDCWLLADVKLPNTLTTMGDNAFSGTALTDIIIPDSVSSIGQQCFISCKNLKSINLGKGITSIGSKAFKLCTSLTNITIPDGVEFIFDEAFNGCVSLTSIVIPESVTYIGSDAFKDCSNLIIYAKNGSFAEAYANTNNILVVYNSAVLLGDVDANEVVQAFDALMALQIATGKKVGTVNEIHAADVNISGGVEAYDALRILQYATGKITEF